MELKIKAEKRAETGKGPSRRLRRQGLIPAILYGHGTNPLALKVENRELREALSTEGGINVLIDLQVVDGKDKESHLVMVKEVQKHPFKEKFIHVDFLKVARDETVTVRIPVAVSGEEECPGIKSGGVLQYNLREVEVECLPADMPEHLFIDIVELEVGDNLRVTDIKLPGGVTIMADPEDVVVTILAPRLEEEEEEVEELEEEEVAAEEEEEVPAEEEKPEEGPPQEGEE